MLLSKTYTMSSELKHSITVTYFNYFNIQSDSPGSILSPGILETELILLCCISTPPPKFSFIYLISCWQTTATIYGARKAAAGSYSLPLSVLSVMLILRWMELSLLDSISLLSDEQNCTVVAVCTTAPDFASVLWGWSLRAFLFNLAAMWWGPLGLVIWA